MRRLNALFILAILIPTLLLYTNGAVAGQNGQEKIDVYKEKKLVKSVVFQVGLNEYFVNNQVPGVKMDVAPFVENGRTFVPVRFLSNALGVQNQNIFWFGGTGRVKLLEPGFPVVELTVGRAEVLSNGSPVPGVDVAPLLRDSRTFLPARFVANALGYDVDWDPTLNLVVCWPKGELKPDVEAVKQLLREVKSGEKILWNGYVLPGPDPKWKVAEGCWFTYTGLEVEYNDPADKYLAELSLYMAAYNASSRAPRQYEEARALIASKWGEEIADRAIEYAKQKTTRNIELATKYFDLPNGGKLEVSGIKTDGVVVLVWKPGQIN